MSKGGEQPVCRTCNTCKKNQEIVCVVCIYICLCVCYQLINILSEFGMKMNIQHSFHLISSTTKFCVMLTC